VGITMKYAQRNDHPSKMGQPSVWKYLFQPGHTTRSKTSLYKCYNNAILDSITESGLGSHLGTISVAAPTCADDILILAISECELQSIMDIIYHHTQRDLVKINPQKSDLICYNTSSERKVNIGD
jgi:hypothetical protein